MEIVSKMAKKIMCFFKKDIMILAKETKFYQRESKLDPMLFLSGLLNAFLNNPNASLEDICQLFRLKKVKITKQGLAQRFNDFAVDFLKKSLTLILSYVTTENSYYSEFSKAFSSVKIIDSTGIELPSRLQEAFPGFGGGASKAALKLQVMWDNIHQKIEFAEITSARRNDQGYRRHLEQIEPGALYLQDLGYFCLDSFEKINQGGAFFISRLSKATKVYDINTKEEICLEKYLKSFNEASECELLIGSKMNKLRCFFWPVPENVKEKRLRDANKAAKKQGYTVSKQSAYLYGWNIFVTNISKEKLSLEKISTLYVLRWQIELLFKTSKSIVGVDKVSGRTASKIQCDIYAKLILIALLTYITSPLKKRIEISLTKAFKKFKNIGVMFLLALDSERKLKTFICELHDAFLNLCGKETRKNRRTSAEKAEILLGGLR